MLVVVTVLPVFKVEVVVESSVVLMIVVSVSSTYEVTVLVPRAGGVSVLVSVAVTYLVSNLVKPGSAGGVTVEVVGSGGYVKSGLPPSRAATTPLLLYEFLQTDVVLVTVLVVFFVAVPVYLVEVEVPYGRPTITVVAVIVLV